MPPSRTTRPLRVRVAERIWVLAWRVRYEWVRALADRWLRREQERWRDDEVRAGAREWERRGM